MAICNTIPDNTISKLLWKFGEFKWNLCGVIVLMSSSGTNYATFHFRHLSSRTTHVFYISFRSPEGWKTRKKYFHSLKQDQIWRPRKILNTSFCNQFFIIVIEEHDSVHFHFFPGGWKTRTFFCQPETGSNLTTEKNIHFIVFFYSILHYDDRRIYRC